MCLLAFYQPPTPTIPWLAKRKLKRPNSLLQDYSYFLGSEPAGTKHLLHPLCGGTPRPASEMGAMILMTLTKTPVPCQKRQRVDEVCRGWPPLSGVRSEGQLGHFSSQSQSFNRVSHRSYAVHCKPSVHIDSTRCDIHIFPPFPSPLKIEAHIKCWRKATHFSEPEFKKKRGCIWNTVMATEW